MRKLRDGMKRFEHDFYGLVGATVPTFRGLGFRRKFDMYLAAGHVMAFLSETRPHSAPEPFPDPSASSFWKGEGMVWLRCNADVQ